VRLLKRLWPWLDDLTGLSVALGPVFTHHVPPARHSGWFYVFGSATLFCFLLQVVTGTALASAYVTSAGSAYDSLKFITSTPTGHFLRGVHAIGASATVVLIGVHAIRVYLMAAYKYPRQMSWLTGAALLLVTLAMAFTGQLLRWDQTGFWTAVIAAEQAGRLPVIGNWFASALLAGDTVGGATLSRFFAAHVFFVPGVIYLALMLHLYLVVRNGISEPPRAGQPVDPRTYRRWYHALLAREGLPFWPYAAWRDVVFGVLVIAVILVLALTLGPPEIGKPPDPTIIDASPRPDWYFLWYFALLSVIPHWTENYVIVLGPLIFGIVLVLLPFLAKAGERSPLKRPWSILIVAGIVVIIAYYGSLGSVAPWSPRFDAKPLSATVVGATSGPVAQGAQVFFAKGCEYCHRVAGEGGIRGPDLTDAGDRMTTAQAATRIYSGATNMPSYTKNLTPVELGDLLAFLASRHRVPNRMASASPSPP
jgi:ubiquinol-cytochrome c reductase cytochrome b subunit